MKQIITAKHSSHYRLIDYCLMANEQKFKYIEYENNLNDIWKLCKNEGRNGSLSNVTEHVWGVE